MFGVTPADLGFPGPPPGVIVNEGLAAGERGIDLDRRDFLTDTIGAVAGVGLPPAPPLTPPDSSGAIGTTHLVELREQLHYLYRLDDAYGGGDVHSLAVRHLRRIRRIINTSAYPDTIGRQLQLLAGETAEHCAWLSYDADDQDSARRYWGEALTIATLLRDPSLEILVLASLAMQANHEGRPRDGLELARAAQERATQYGSPVLQSLIAVREARALSLMTDKTTANRRMSTAMHLAERTDRGRPTPQWAAFHGPAELDYAQGLLYSELGHHGAAVNFLRACLGRQDRTYGRNRALYRLTLAGGLIAAGEVDEGAAYALESLDHIEEVESARVMLRLNEAADVLSTLDATPARDAADTLTTYLHERQAA